MNCVCFVHAHTTAISIKCIYTVGGIIGSIRPFTKPIKKVDHRNIFDQINAILVNIIFFQNYLQNKTTLQNQQNKKLSSNVEQCVCVCLCDLDMCETCVMIRSTWREYAWLCYLQYISEKLQHKPQPAHHPHSDTFTLTVKKKPV